MYEHAPPDPRNVQYPAHMHEQVPTDPRNVQYPAHMHEQVPTDPRNVQYPARMYEQTPTDPRNVQYPQRTYDQDPIDPRNFQYPQRMYAQAPTDPRNVQYSEDPTNIQFYLQHTYERTSTDPANHSVYPQQAHEQAPTDQRNFQHPQAATDPMKIQIQPQHKYEKTPTNPRNLSMHPQKTHELAPMDSNSILLNAQPTYDQVPMEPKTARANAVHETYAESNHRAASAHIMEAQDPVPQDVRASKVNAVQKNNPLSSAPGSAASHSFSNTAVSPIVRSLLPADAADFLDLQSTKLIAHPPDRIYLQTIESTDESEYIDLRTPLECRSGDDSIQQGSIDHSPPSFDILTNNESNHNSTYIDHDDKSRFRTADSNHTFAAVIESVPTNQDNSNTPYIESLSAGATEIGYAPSTQPHQTTEFKHIESLLQAQEQIMSNNTMLQLMVPLTPTAIIEHQSEPICHPPESHNNSYTPEYNYHQQEEDIRGAEGWTSAPSQYVSTVFPTDMGRHYDPKVRTRRTSSRVSLMKRKTSPFSSTVSSSLRSANNVQKGKRWEDDLRHHVQRV